MPNSVEDTYPIFMKRLFETVASELNVALPVTPRVEESVVAPLTPSVEENEPVVADNPVSVDEPATFSVPPTSAS